LRGYMRLLLLYVFILVDFEFSADAFTIPRNQKWNRQKDNLHPLVNVHLAWLPLSYDRLGLAELVDPPPAMETNVSADLSRKFQKFEDERNKEEPRIILPQMDKESSLKARSEGIGETIQQAKLNIQDKPKTPSGFSSWRLKVTTTLRKGFKRPSTRFRVTLLSVSAFAGLALVRINTKRVNAAVSLATAVQGWIHHRGFQGLAAMGRTFAYAWAALVAYPRLLDRRATERQQKRRDKQLELRRNELIGFATEVFRLQQELASIDAEIRSFRREIISLRALVAAQVGNNHGVMNNASSGKKSSPSSFTTTTTTTSSSSGGSSSSTPHVDDIQNAIAAEMSHLEHLRADTQTALTVARQMWAEARAQSPPEAWPASSVILSKPPSSSHSAS